MNIDASAWTRMIGEPGSNHPASSGSNSSAPARVGVGSDDPVANLAGQPRSHHCPMLPRAS